MLVHEAGCEYGLSIRPEFLTLFDDLHDALSAGYAEAGCCLTDRSYTAMRAAAAERQNMTNAFRAQGCLICGETRGVQRAHVMPQMIGGTEVIPLCPSHHWAYDHGELTANEMIALESACRERGRQRLAREVRKFHGSVKRNIAKQARLNREDRGPYRPL